MDSVRSQDSQNGETCGRVGHRNGIRVSSSVSRLSTARRRMRRRSTTTVKYCCHCVPHCRSFLQSSNEFMSTIPTHAVFIILNPLMVDLLQLDYQNKKMSPFETHAPTMWIFFVATCMHCLGLAFEMKIQTSASSLFCRIFTNLILFAGALSSIALASTFLPPALGWVCLGLWTLLPFLVGFPLLVSALKWFCEKAMEVVKCFSVEKLCLPK